MADRNSKISRTTKPEALASRTTGATTDHEGLIVLPALKGSEAGTSVKKSPRRTPSAHDSQNIKQKKSRAHPPSARAVRQNDAKERAQEKPAPRDRELLPEYRSKTDGLRELLSTIDPHDNAPRARLLHNRTRNPGTDSFATAPTPATPPAPGPHASSPSLDLPAAPTRWGLYLATTFGALSLLFVSALVYSHISSPTGINWSKVEQQGSRTWQRIIVALGENTGPVKPARETARPGLPPLSPQQAQTKETRIATAPRISTTAASPARGNLTPPPPAEIFISPQELENQIRALEQTPRRREAAVANPVISRPAPGKRTGTALKTSPSPGFDPLAVIPAVNIDPDMENRIFSRASSYLKQRDISSARMILQYAASLGSGISAMALAETFDPAYLEKNGLQDVSASRPEALKWYAAAARLGVREANARLTALK